MWTHGDWASRDDDGYWFLHGRSDDTINVAGKRIGPAEIESVLATHTAVAESRRRRRARCGQGRVDRVLVVLRAGAERRTALVEELRATVREHLGSAFTPARVVFAEALPKTRSAKIVRRVVRAGLTGDDAGDLSSLEDPHVLEAIRRSAQGE